MSEESHYNDVNERLKEIVETVSDETLPLDDALDLFEEAVRLGMEASTLMEEDMAARDAQAEAAEQAADEAFAAEVAEDAPSSQVTADTPAVQIAEDVSKAGEANIEGAKVTLATTEHIEIDSESVL